MFPVCAVNENLFAALCKSVDACAKFPPSVRAVVMIYDNVLYYSIHSSNLSMWHSLNILAGLAILSLA
jgi:hypothetical protein